MYRHPSSPASKFEDQPPDPVEKDSTGPQLGQSKSALLDEGNVVDNEDGHGSDLPGDDSPRKQHPELTKKEYVIYWNEMANIKSPYRFHSNLIFISLFQSISQCRRSADVTKA